MTHDSAEYSLIPTGPAPEVLHSDDVQVRWVMPENFHDIPIDATDDEDAVHRLGELVEKALPGAGEEAQTALAVTCALGVDELLAAGAEYAGICVTAVDGAACTATVFSSLIDSPRSDTLQGTVRVIAAELRALGEGEVSRIELPCGWAVSHVGTRDVKVLGELTENGEGFTFSTPFIRVYVPLPNGRTLVMEMSTPTTPGWDMFSTMFGNIVSSIRLFRADGSPLITSMVGE
ncbi:hypothetical protein [Streptomyces sp. I5]|uniref:hypothetical protein n=1 Tax=Streptomyces sp. I5 TaxID=2759947 RepID=UPI0018EE5D69|nr:hypothetical protein [Streptomyces sp. I5]MBJ6634067.1 hypothetical protein [Streptomyces sp. I5]